MTLLLAALAHANDGAFNTDNPAASRYTVYTPSALHVGHLQGTVSQKNLLFTVVGLGLGDHVELVFKASPVVLLHGLATGGPTQDANVGGLRFKTSLSPTLHVGAAVDGMVSYQSSGAGSDVDKAGMGTAYGTWGDGDRNLTLGGGVRYTRDNTYLSPWGPVASLAGQARFTDRWGIVSENMAANWGGEWVYTTSAAARMMGRRFSIDAGVLYTTMPLYVVENRATPVPWLDATWYFGRVRGAEG
jgi:hypothetical protein